MDDKDSLIGLYLRAFASVADSFWKLTHLVVADAFFANNTFVTGLDQLAFDLVSRFCDNIRLRYLYKGPKQKKPGRPKKFDGKVDVHKPRKGVFATTTVDDGAPPSRSITRSSTPSASSASLAWSSPFTTIPTRRPRCARFTSPPT